MINEVFQASELVEPYRVAPSIDLEENLNFRVFNDSLVDIDAEELNVVLSSTSGKRMLLKKMIMKLKSTMQLIITIQLRTKMKIPTN